ncbi:MAG: hypothetical protein ACOC2W_00155 [bacterium]
MNDQINKVLSQNLTKIKNEVNKFLTNMNKNELDIPDNVNITCIETLYVINEDKEFQIGVLLSGSEDNNKLQNYIRDKLKQVFNFSNILVFVQ